MFPYEPHLKKQNTYIYILNAIYFHMAFSMFALNCVKVHCFKYAVLTRCRLFLLDSYFPHATCRRGFIFFTSREEPFNLRLGG